MNEFIYSGKEELENSLVMKRYNNHIASVLFQAMNSQSKTLDYGAGIGVITDLIKEKLEINPICFEIDNDQALFLKTKGYDTYSSIKKLKEKAPFDVVFSTNVLEHVPDDIDALKDIRGILKENGVFVTWVPAFNAVWTKMDDRVGHLRRYTKKEMSVKLIEAGFEVVDLYYQDFLGFFLSWLFKFLGNDDGKATKSQLIFFDKFIFPLSKMLDCIFKRFLGKNLVVIAKK